MQGEAERALRCRRPSLPSRPHFDADSIDSAIPRPGTGGLTLAYGILIRLGEFDLRLLSHECPMCIRWKSQADLELSSPVISSRSPTSQQRGLRTIRLELVTTLAYQTVRQI